MLKQKICNLINVATSDGLSTAEVTFDLHDKSIQRIHKDTGINLIGYQCRIHADSVRHVKKGHPDDVRYLCFIPAILKSFDTVQIDIRQDRITKQNVVSFVFHKKYNADLIKLVKVRVLRDKTLDLKTMFVKDA